MRRRVVITGIGAVTPVGNDVAAVWESVKRGASGIGPITHFDASSFPTTFAAEVKGFDFDAVVDDPAPFKAAGRNVRFAVGAATQAMRESGLLDGPHAPAPDRFGVYLGAGEGQQNFHVFMQMLADAGASPGGGAGPRGVHEARHGAAGREGGVGAGAEHAQRPPRSPVRRPGAEPELPDGLRGEFAGDRGGDRNHPPGRRGRDALRRGAQHDPPVRADRVQPADLPLHPQRRPAGRQPAVRRRPATGSCWARGPGCWCWRSTTGP